MPTGVYERNPLSEEHRKKLSFIAKRNGFGKWMKGRHLSEETKTKIKKKLRKRSVIICKCGKCFYPKRKNSKYCSKKCGFKYKISPGSIYWKGKKLSDIHKQKLKEAKLKNPVRYWLGKKRQDLSKEKHFNWKGGVSFEPYAIDWDNKLKDEIRFRDNYTCKICGKKQKKVSHSVHHIDYNKKNCNINNLITLCVSCHIKTNFNRDYWIKYFEINEVGLV